MIDLDSAFGQQLFDVAVRQCVPEIPADCHDDHIRREPESRERGPRRTYPTRATRHQLTLPCPSSLDATEPMYLLAIRCSRGGMSCSPPCMPGYRTSARRR